MEAPSLNQVVTWPKFTCACARERESARARGKVAETGKRGVIVGQEWLDGGDETWLGGEDEGGIKGG